MPKTGKGSKPWVKDKLATELDSRLADLFEHDNDRGHKSRPRLVPLKSKRDRKHHKHGRKHHKNILSLQDAMAMLNFQDVAVVEDKSGATSSHGKGSYNTPYAASGGHHDRERRMTPRVGRDGTLEDLTGWFRIRITGGAKHAKAYLLGILRAHLAPVELLPVEFRTDDQDVVFHVDNKTTAQALHDADDKIDVGGDFKLGIYVLPVWPKINLNATMEERILMVMMKHYNPDTKTLDLSRFHMDPDLVEDTTCAISHYRVPELMLNLIHKHFPELVGLNLDRNNISAPDTLAKLPRKAPNLQILHLGFNRFRYLTGFSKLNELPLTELRFEGNPLQNMADKTQYIRAVRKVFTKLTRLDDMDLPKMPKTIGFDLEVIQPPLPSAHDRFECSDVGADLARNFVGLYFQMFDMLGQSTREPLLEAYHEQAIFSLTSVYPPSSVLPKHGPKLNTYISDSRNLLRVLDPERREKMLLRGRLSIVSFLNALPRTEHEPKSLTFDLTVFTPQLMVMTLTGVFRELDTEGVPLRHFLRKFVLVPVGAGYCIINEMMFVSNANPAEMKAFPARSAPSMSIPYSTIQPSQSLSPETWRLWSSETLREHNVATLAAKTNMTLHWARKCLEGAEWDFKHAVVTFTTLKYLGALPPELFQC